MHFIINIINIIKPRSKSIRILQNPNENVIVAITLFLSMV